MSAPTDREAAEQVLGYITGARWFAGKGRQAELARVTPLPWLTEVGQWPALRFEVAEIRYPGAPDADGSADPRELYQLAVCYRSSPQPGLEHAEIGRFVDAELGEVVAYDAMHDPEACRLVLDRLVGAGHYGGHGSEVSFHLVSGDALGGELEPRTYSGQQSNTSVMYGDAAMLKLFRRLEIGHNLDIEVHESLSRSGVGDVAQLYGWIEASWPAGDPGGASTLTADLGMMVEKLADAQDGWELALSTLREESCFADLAHALGRALAEIHQALRSEFPTAEVSGAEVSQVMRARLDVAVGIAPALAPHLAGLQRSFESLAGSRLSTQRVHGDFHLGQTLHTPGGWKIIDFEGEPVKTLAERAVPDSVWRDIAGMLRSFDYAAASVPGPRSTEWSASCRDAFLQGYVGGPLAAADQAVLQAYEADKAIYEVVYEVRNRPDWVNIPLAAVAAIANASADAERIKE